MPKRPEERWWWLYPVGMMGFVCAGAQTVVQMAGLLWIESWRTETAFKVWLTGMLIAMCVSCLAGLGLEGAVNRACRKERERRRTGPSS